MDRIAYIISAYKDASHLLRLVDALDDGRADFYLHIDRKADSRPFRELLEGRATFVPSHWVSWGGWEQVEYQKELLAAVIRSGREYSRVVCLSGQDYPLWTNGQIHQWFEAHPRTEFIAGMNLTRCSDASQRAKITCYHPFRDLPWRSLWWKNKLIVLSRHLLKALPLRKQPVTTIGGQRAEVFFGSDYWAITLPCARYVYEKLTSEEKLIRYFRTSFVPSELCIQTIVFNSPFGANALLYEGAYPGLWKLTPLHYIYYDGSIKTLTLADKETLQSCGKMFCRKVVSGASDALVAYIDAGREGKSTYAPISKTFMRKKEEIHIALSADSNYVMPVTVALQSLFEHHPHVAVQVYLLYLKEELQEKDLAFITCFVHEKGGGFVPLEVTKEQIAGFPETRHGKAALLRLCLPQLLPHLDKILYVDGDIIVMDNLMELFRTDMDRHYIAAAKDTLPVYHADYIRQLGIISAHEYFNTGVTLLNLKELRTINLQEVLSAFAQAHYTHTVYPDQDALNYICQGKMLYIHPRYNMNYAVEKDVAGQVWGKRQFREAKQKPAIVHFIGPIKPWSALSVHPWRRAWWASLAKTPFAGYKPADSCMKNRLRRSYLWVSKQIEGQLTLEGKQRIGRLVPAALKKRLKKTLLKKV